METETLKTLITSVISSAVPNAIGAGPPPLAPKITININIYNEKPQTRKKDMKLCAIPIAAFLLMSSPALAQSPNPRPKPEQVGQVVGGIGVIRDVNGDLRLSYDPPYVLSDGRRLGVSNGKIEFLKDSPAPRKSTEVTEDALAEHWMDYQETRIRLQKIRLYNATVLFADATFRGVDVFVSLQNVPSQIVTSLIRNCGGFNTADNDCLVTLEGNLDPVTGRHLNFSDVVISPTVKAPEKK